MKLNKNKLTAGAISIIIISLLIISSPASAFEMKLTADKQEVDSGAKITFTASIDIKSGERIPIEEIVLVLDGPEKRECSFDITGKIKSGKESQCFGINIKKIIQNSIEEGYGYRYGYYNGSNYFGYGYGYGEQKLEYEITMHTQHFQAGEYESLLKIAAKNQDNSFSQFSQNGAHIKINEVEEEDEDDDSSSSSSGCRTKWVCTDWSSCTNGQQIRNCNKEKIYCYAEDKPEEQRSCSANEATGKSKSGEDSVENLDDINAGKNKGIFSGITGAVTGVADTIGTPGLIGAVLFVVIIAGASVTITIIRKNKIKGKTWKSY